MVPSRVLSRTNLAGSSPSTSSISFTSFRLRTLDLSLCSFLDSRPLFSITSALFLQNTRGGIPLREIFRCTEAQKCLSVTPLFATLTHSVSRKSFPCHSYANTRDGGATAAANFERFLSPLVYPERSPRRATRHSPLSCYPSLPPSHAPRSASIPCDLSRLRILPVTTGVYPIRFRFLGVPLQTQLPAASNLRALSASVAIHPLFSQRYKSLSPQPLSFHIHANPQGVWG